MKNSTVSRVVAVTLLMAACIGSMQAAEKIRLDRLQERLGPAFESRNVNVITHDGQKYHSQRLEFGPDQVTLYNRDKLVEAVPRQDVAQIEIRERKRYYRHIAENVLVPLALPIIGAVLLSADSVSGGPLGFAVGAVLAPPLFACGVVSAPVLLAADAVAFFKPARVFEIAQ